MSIINQLSKAIGFERLSARQAFSTASCALDQEEKKISIMTNIGKRVTRVLLLAAAVSIGLLPAQTPFLIASVNSGQVLDVPYLSTAAGAQIQQYPVNLGANQQWTFRRVTSSTPYTYEIVSVNSGLVLDVPGLSTTPGTLIQQWAENGGPNQQWRFARAPGSTGYEIISSDYEFINPGNDGFGQSVNLVLDVPGLSTAPGTLIQQWAENDGFNQQWLLYPLALTNISSSGSNGTIFITGWGFKPGTEVCPVFNALFPGACATVLTNGTFSSATSSFGSIRYNSGAPGYVVVIVEDHNGNVLAIGSVPGGTYENIQ